MSIIKADTLPKRGAELTSTDLNEVYTDINAGFPLNGDNVRNEGVALPQMDTQTLNGKTDIVLRAANQENEGHGSGIIVRANEQTAHPYDNPTQIQELTDIIPLQTNDILRVYFEIDGETNDSSASPFAAGTNDIFWVFWLEWKLTSGGSYVPVEGQTDYDDILISPATYGGKTIDSQAAIFVAHGLVHEHSSSTDVDPMPRRGHSGSFYYREDGSRTIYGLRIMGKGLMRGGYASGVVLPPDSNAAFITISPASTHQIKVYNSSIGYIRQRSS